MHVLPQCITDTFIPLFSFIIIDPSNTDWSCFRTEFWGKYLYNPRKEVAGWQDLHDW